MNCSVFVNKIKVITWRVTLGACFWLDGVPESFPSLLQALPTPCSLRSLTWQADLDGWHQWAPLHSGFSRFNQRESPVGERVGYEVGGCILWAPWYGITLGWLSHGPAPPSFWPRFLSALSLVLSLCLAPPIYKLSFYHTSMNYPHVSVPLFPATTLTDTDGNRKPFWGSDI